MKVAVEVLEAHDLVPKDSGGTASPFVEVDFDGQRRRTQTKPHDLNPFWNEVLIFDVADPLDLPSRTINVAVYHDGSAGGGRQKGRSFLGRVRLSGSSVAPSREEAALQVCSLDRRRLFFPVRGDLALRIFAVLGSSKASSSHAPSTTTTVPETHSSEKPLPATKERKVFHTVGFEPARTRAREFTNMEKKHSRSHHFRAEAAAPAPAMHMEAPPQPKPDYGLKETQPPVAARTGYRGGTKITTTYDLVEQMEYLYVNIVKARNLPAMDITGSVDPYVEVKLGNFIGRTKHLEKNQNPEWHQVFAFSKERLQADRLVVSVKDKDLLMDGFVGRVVLPLVEVPSRLPPDSPLAPQWYRLEEERRDQDVGRGELMMAVWKGSQADEAYPEAWHSDAHTIPLEAVLHTRSKVYFAPRLCYLRVHAIAAQDLVPSEATRLRPETHVKVQLGHQIRFTRPSPVRSLNPSWNEELMLVGSEPFDEPVTITVEDRIGPGKDVPLGRLVLTKPRIPTQADHRKIMPAQWFDLAKPTSSSAGSGEERRRESTKFSSKLHLRIFYDAGYHVIDEPVQYSSDFQPSSKPLRKQSIGILELGILSAKDLVPMNASNGAATTDAYCVAKYGPKWVRTRTILGSLSPKWNEQYTWDVFDLCTVLTIAVFDNCQLYNNGSKNGNGSKDQRIGKIRIRLSTLQTDKLYTHYHPLLALEPSGLKKFGELHLAIRFTCAAWTNMLLLYTKPTLPKMHYIQPIPVMQMNYLRTQAMGVVMARLARAEPPLRKEVVEYVLDVGSHLFSMRRSKANFGRLVVLFSGVPAAARWFDGIRYWKNPVTTILVHVLFLILVFYPSLILPTVFLYLFAIGVWNFRFRPAEPPHMDTELSCAELVTTDDLDEEFDPFVTRRPIEVVKRRYDRLRFVAGRVQELVGFLATQGERVRVLLSWRDPRATAIFIVFSEILAVLLFATPIRVVLALAGLYLLRHPRFRSKMPSVSHNFFRRLPAESDILL
ncbi:FT-interacting protein 7-like [Phoenix dactylifera]|uniref:FT-interacting protein 7-like n=1 Tax=Phoenix dactylifera TaxID=42345 RepID=A0A8B7BMH6_PHODC|nr:FT-interacting protein 7-like [Phoenix dactylifera]